MPSKVDIELLERTLNEIRPALHGDGGDLALLGVDDEGVVTVQLMGACGDCPLQIVTLAAGIEVLLQKNVPGVSGVIAQSPTLPEQSGVAG